MQKIRSLFSGLRLRANIYYALLLSLLLSMMLFTLCRVGFFLFNKDFFSDQTIVSFLRILAGGLRFDLTAILYVNAAFIVMMIIPFKFRFNRHYLKVAAWLFYCTNAIALALNVIDFVYFRFTLRRTTADVFQQFENETNLSSLFFRFLVDYWYGVVFWMALIVCMVWLFKKIKITGPMIVNRYSYYVMSVAAALVTAFLFVGGVRGGYAHSTRPITLNDAGKYVSDTRDISLVLNTPFAIMRTFGKTKIQKLNYYSETELEKVFTPVHLSSDTVLKKDNVVIIILESFSKEFFGAFNSERNNGTYSGYTPFLDSLIQHSRTYEYSFANGRKSIDGLPSVLASIPSMGVPYILTPYSGNTINSLGSLLKQQGYHTSFFHGAPNGSMGFDAFLNTAGFDHYYGMNEYGNEKDFDGWWGIWDDKFFNFYADKLNTFQPPFLSGIFSVSSHHPFLVPDEYKQQFKGGKEPILKCIQYTDFALRNFFRKASGMPWFKNTVFVITADHTSSNIVFDDTRTASGLYSVPLIFYKPDNSLSGRENSIAQQIDIMPSILSLLQYPENYVAFGRDLFKQDITPYAVNYKDNTYQFFQDDYLLLFDGSKSKGLYNFKTDKMSVENLMGNKTDVAHAMEARLKALLQQYNNRMIENRMTIK